MNEESYYMQLFSAALISIAIILCMGLNGNFQSSLPYIMHKKSV